MKVKATSTLRRETLYMTKLHLPWTLMEKYRNKGASEQLKKKKKAFSC
jgi:hypothetical protein